MGFYSPTRIRPVPPELKGWSFKHWTARDIPEVVFIKLGFMYLIVHLFIHTPNIECPQHAENCYVLETQTNLWLQHRVECVGSAVTDPAEKEEQSPDVREEVRKAP